MNFLTAINRQLPLIAVMFALLCLGWTLQHHLLAGESSAEKASAGFDPVSDEPTEGPAASAKLGAEQLKEIAQRHLFGQLAKPKVAEPTPIEPPKEIEPDFSNLPETRIPLKLSGIAFSPDKNRAFAMIITADGKQADYQAGEPIGKEAKVHLIEQRRVVIERDGKFEALSLPDLKNAERNLTSPSRTTANRAQRQPDYTRPGPVRPLPNKQQ